MNSPRTAILSYALGTGHRRVGDILAGELAALGHTCDHRPLEEWVPWDYDLLFRRGYLLAVLHLQFVWESMYRSPRFTKKEALAFPIMRPRAWRRFGQEGLGDYDLVVATQYNAMEIAADWKKFTGRPLRLAAVITDYDTYPLWARPEVDLFLVAHGDLVDPLVRLGVPREKVHAPGIPIAPVFQEPQDGMALKSSLGLDLGRPTALVFGGGFGAGPMEACVKAALCVPEWQVIAVCGLNEKLRRRFVPLAQEHSGRVRVLGYRTDVPALMAASDVIVTKGGGLSLTEALYSGAKVVAVPSLPGQEMANIDFMASHGWAEPCKEPSGLQKILAQGRPPRRTLALPPAPAHGAALLLAQLAKR
jgi:processive 1,2-diacylglycerol beta-glucosyltransferase